MGEEKRGRESWIDGRRKGRLEREEREVEMGGGRGRGRAPSHNHCPTMGQIQSHWVLATMTQVLQKARPIGAVLWFYRL